MSKTIENIMSVIAYIEDHLEQNLDLDTLAKAVHYSKYHLHRMFTDTVGLTIHEYVQRRRLTEAARMLVFSSKPVLEIALMAGYESQQAFSGIFKAMYKKSPGQYREAETFYPLQLAFVLDENPPDPAEKTDWQQRIVFASQEDIPAWMELVRLVVDGFPYLDEESYLKQLQEAVRARRALILKDKDKAAAVMIFRAAAGSIDFLAVHPQYRKQGIARAFCRKALYELACPDEISVTTFREGDKADPGYRLALQNLGFAEAELLVEFGYPTQRFVLYKDEEMT